MVDKTYLLDTSAFITPYRFYYAFDLVPSYWRELLKVAECGKIIFLDLVKREIEQGEDSLRDWMGENGSKFTVCNHVTDEIVGKYQEVIRYIQSCGYYSQKALHAWSQGNIADPWLIATAAVKHYLLLQQKCPQAR